jgi:hypothetical protein
MSTKMDVWTEETLRELRKKEGELETDLLVTNTTRLANFKLLQDRLLPGHAEVGICGVEWKTERESLFKELRKTQELKASHYSIFDSRLTHLKATLIGLRYSGDETSTMPAGQADPKPTVPTFFEDDATVPQTGAPKPSASQIEMMSPPGCNRNNPTSQAANYEDDEEDDILPTRTLASAVFVPFKNLIQMMMKVTIRQRS